MRKMLLLSALLIFTAHINASTTIWESVPNPVGETHPKFPFADNTGNLYLASEHNGFYKSVDTGQNWNLINGGGLPTMVGSGGFAYPQWIKKDPTTGFLFVGIMDESTNPGTGKVFRSTDEGLNWTILSGLICNGTTGYPGRPEARYCRLPNGNILFGGYWTASQYTGLFCSTDQGVSCTPIANPNGVATGSAMSVGYNSVTGDCWMGGEAAGSCVFRSTDMGRTWNLIPTFTGYNSNGDAFSDCYQIAFNKAGDVLIMGSQGLYRSQDFGAHWTEVYSSGSDLIGALSYHPDCVSFDFGHDCCY